MNYKIFIYLLFINFINLQFINSQFINEKVFDISLISNIINKFRYKHKVPNLQYNKTLELFAQNWCQYLMDNNLFMHSKNRLYGENLYYQINYINQDNTLIVNESIKAWYDENTLYNYNLNQFQFEAGHFTALVWKNTKLYGIGFIKKNSKSIVCMNTFPPGNVDGAYLKNVLRP